jgi:hypothetical protein
MKGQLSIQEVVVSLKKQAAFHRERMAEHAEKEAFHREFRSMHETELGTITSRLEGFLTAAAAAVEISGREAPQSAAEEEVDYGSASNPKLTKMVRAVLEGIGPYEPFGPNGVFAEVDRRFGSGLRSRLDLRQISDILRRLHRTGSIYRLRTGIPHHESRYVQRLEVGSA